MEYEIDKKLSTCPACPSLLSSEHAYHYEVITLPACACSFADIKSRDDVLRMGIDKYNEECRSIVMR